MAEHKTTSTIEVELLDDIAIMTPLNDIATMTPLKGLGAFDFSSNDAREAMQALDKDSIKHVLVDLHRTDYFGSSVVGWLLTLHDCAKQIGGSVAICSISDNEKTVLECMKVDRMFHFYPSRDEALKAIEKTP